MSPKIGGFTTKWETISIKPPKGTPSVYSRLQFIPGIFFGRGGCAGAMFRRGMSTLLRVEGDSPAQGLSNCKCPAGKLLALFH